jgi:3-carboxy-cis,cis-muconate cycloisomerase
MAETGAWLATLIGALAKIGTDVVHLASTEVGEIAEPHVPGRGGSSAMPHKRNPVSATVILAAHASAKGLLVTLLDAMAAAHERPAGSWHAEWHALPQLFGLASGALREGRRLAEGLEVDARRMRANLDLTKGLLFADAAAAALAPSLGRERAHRLVEEAADEVRQTGRDLRAVLTESAGEHAASLEAAFDLAPATAAAAQWVEPAIAAAERALAQLDPPTTER